MNTDRIAVLQKTGIRTIHQWPEKYSHDGRFTLGEAPDIKGYFVLARVNSPSTQSGPVAGKALADWIMKGHAPIYQSEMDPKRCEDFQARDTVLSCTTQLERRDLMITLRHSYIVAMETVVALLADAREHYAILTGLAPSLHLLTLAVLMNG